MPHPEVVRLSAFTDDPAGGNPAGVVLADAPLDPAWMQQTAAEVGYSETAFLWPEAGERRWTVRYFSPKAEVPFCGHATIATGALLAQRWGDATHHLDTRAGEVAVDVQRGGAAAGRASLTSVEPRVLELPAGLVDHVLRTFGWARNHLAPQLEPALAFGGARHLLLPVRSRQVLSEMRYDFDALLALMSDNDLTTVALLWQQDASTWHARNAFPVGGVIEDPATGAAAAAFGGWLRATRQVEPPVQITVHQGEDMGRPSRLAVTVPASGGIIVAGDVAQL